MKLVKESILLMILLVGMAVGSAVAKDNLAILPFTGGRSDEGETIAELFSGDKRLFDLFGIISRTAITRAINDEQNFQMDSGMTDPDTIVSIAHALGAQYVVSGSITSLGRNKLLVISIIKIEDIQQIAGDIVTYNNIEEIPEKLPGMVDKIIAATQINTTSLSKLAIEPVDLRDGADKRTADVLAQILAINLIRSGKYAIYPRTTSSLEAVQAEHRNQQTGYTGDENIAAPGKGVNPDLVLSVIARKLANTNMFNAAVYNIKTGLQETPTASVNYATINDGMRVMETIVKELTGLAEPIRRLSSARLFSAGVSFGSAFTAPWGIGTIHGTFSVFKYMFVDIGCDFGILHGYMQKNDLGYFSLYPFSHINGFLPFGEYGGWYAGIGSGYMVAFYQEEGKNSIFSVPAFDVTTGLYLGKGSHYFTFEYTLRTTFEAVNHKVALGYSFRF